MAILPFLGRLLNQISRLAEATDGVVKRAVMHVELVVPARLNLKTMLFIDGELSGFAT